MALDRGREVAFDFRYERFRHSAELSWERGKKAERPLVLSLAGNAGAHSADESCLASLHGFRAFLGLFDVFSEAGCVRVSSRLISSMYRKVLTVLGRAS